MRKKIHSLPFFLNGDIGLPGQWHTGWIWDGQPVWRGDLFREAWGCRVHQPLHILYWGHCLQLHRVACVRGHTWYLSILVHRHIIKACKKYTKRRVNSWIEFLNLSGVVNCVTKSINGSQCHCDCFCSVNTNHGFLCTMHSMQCNCAREPCAHPQDWSQGLATAEQATQKMCKSRLKVWLDSRNSRLSTPNRRRLQSADHCLCLCLGSWFTRK